MDKRLDATEGSALEALESAIKSHQDGDLGGWELDLVRRRMLAERTVSEIARTNPDTHQLQEGVNAYQNWKANVNAPASSAYGGNLHDLARRMYEAMTNAAPQERSAEASSRADGEASAAKKPGATASTPCQAGEAEPPCGAAPLSTLSAVAEKIDLERVKEWAYSKDRKPAEAAFTAGAERQVAYMIEDARLGIPSSAAENHALRVPEGMWYFSFYCEDFDSVQRVRVKAEAPRQFTCGVTGIAKAEAPRSEIAQPIEPPGWLAKLQDLHDRLERELASTPQSASITLPKPQRVELAENAFGAALREAWPYIKALSDRTPQPTSPLSAASAPFTSNEPPFHCVLGLEWCFTIGQCEQCRHDDMLAKPKLTPLSAENLASRKPLPPEVLACAKHDKVEIKEGRTRKVVPAPCTAADCLEAALAESVHGSKVALSEIALKPHPASCCALPKPCGAINCTHPSLVPSAARLGQRGEVAHRLGKLARAWMRLKEDKGDTEYHIVKLVLENHALIIEALESSPSSASLTKPPHDNKSDVIDEPYCWYHADLNEVSFAENIPGPYWIPLYKAPRSAIAEKKS